MPTFQTPQRFQGSLGLGAFAPVVGASFGVVAELDDAGHVQHVVQPPVTCPGQAVVGVFAAGGIDGRGSGPGNEIVAVREAGHVRDVGQDPGGPAGPMPWMSIRCDPSAWTAASTRRSSP